MNNQLEDLEHICIHFLKEKQIKNDPSHDFNHAIRVLENAKKIVSKENIGDLKILIPACLFHDIVMIPKNHKKADLAPEKSGEVAYRFLIKNANHILSTDDSQKVKTIINTCSFSKNLSKDCIEGHILQDADLLESIGAISIMRTFSSSGLMNLPLFNSKDPFCEKRVPTPQKYALDLFFSRLLQVQSRLHTNTAKDESKQRIQTLHLFLESLKNELLFTNN